MGRIPLSTIISQGVGGGRWESRHPLLYYLPNPTEVKNLKTRIGDFGLPTSGIRQYDVSLVFHYAERIYKHEKSFEMQVNYEVIYFNYF